MSTPTSSRLEADEGIVGNGEAGLWAHHKMVYEAILELSDYYIGKDPTRIEHHYQVVSRDTHFMGSVLNAAMSALDVAMWDILSKSVNLPVYQLLGGKLVEGVVANASHAREKVKFFNNVAGETLTQRAESAIRSVEEGFISLRTTLFFSGFEKDTSTKIITQAAEIVKTIR